MNPLLVGAALVVLAGALAAGSARDPRWVLGGLVACLGSAGLLADPLPSPLAIAIRLVAVLLGADLVLLALRGSPGPTRGAPLGPVTSALAAAAAVVVGYSASGVGSAAAGPALAAATGLGLATIAIGPVILGRDILRVGTGLALLATAVELLRAGLAGTPGPLEQALIALVSVTILGALAAIVATALRAGHDLALAGGVLHETLFEAHPLLATSRGSAGAEVGRRLPGRGPAARPRRDAAAHQLTLEERLRRTAAAEPAAEPAGALGRAGRRHAGDRGLDALAGREAGRGTEAGHGPETGRREGAGRSRETGRGRGARAGMSLLPFEVITIAAAVISLVARGRPRFEVPAAIGGLLAAALAAFLIAPGDALRLGSGEVLLSTAYGRLFLFLAAGSGVVLTLVALITSWQPNVPAAILVGLAGMGLGLSLSDPLLALLALLAAAIAVALVSLDQGVGAAGARVVIRQVRLVVLAGVLAYVAIAWAAPALSGIGSDPAAFGLADLAIVLAVAIRFGAIPFHRSVARLTDTAPGLALPLVLVWGPAALAVVVLGVTDGTSIALLVPSGIGQALIVAIGTASLVLGAVGAWLQDDLEHVVGYSIIQDAGFVLLGLAIGGSQAHEPARIWLLVMLTTKTAFAAWVAVVEARFRTARLPELDGWVRRSPLLALGLLGIVVATIGAPGLLAWNARVSLVAGATGGPLQAVLLVAGLASLLYYGRIALVGMGRPSLLVGASAGDRPVATARSGRAVEAIELSWRTNRAPIAAGLVLVLVVVSLIVASGGLGGPEAARAAGPEPSPAGLGR